MGKELAKKGIKKYQIPTKLQKMLRKRHRDEYGQASELTFAVTQKGIDASQSTLDLVRDKHLRFIKPAQQHGAPSSRLYSPKRSSCVSSPLLARPAT